MYVYFVQSGKKGPIKIGKAKNIEKRLVALQTACPYKLNLLALIKCDSCTEALALEKKIHRLFKTQRMHGEWFRPNINFGKAIKYEQTPNFQIVPTNKALDNEISEDGMSHMQSIVNG